MNSAGQRSPTRPLAQRKLALGPSETSPSPRRPALTSRRVSEPTGSPREGTSCLPVNCTGTGDRFPYPSPLRGKITGLAVFGSAASPTVRYFSTAAGLPAGVGAKTSSFRDVRGRNDHRRPRRDAIVIPRQRPQMLDFPRNQTPLEPRRQQNVSPTHQTHRLSAIPISRRTPSGIPIWCARVRSGLSTGAVGLLTARCVPSLRESRRCLESP